MNILIDQTIIDKEKKEYANDESMMIDRIVSYLCSIHVVERVRGGGLFVNNTHVYSSKKALKLLKII